MYILCGPGLAPHHWSRLTSNVRPRKPPNASCLVIRMQPCLVIRTQPRLAITYASVAFTKFAAARPAALTSRGVRGKSSRPANAHDCDRRCSSRQPLVCEAPNTKELNHSCRGTPARLNRSRWRSVVALGAVMTRGCESLATEEYRCNEPRPPRPGAPHDPSPGTGLRSRVSSGNEFAHQSSQSCISPPPRPNPSFEARPNGKPPAPGRWYAVHFHRPGAGALPSVPPQLER